jgi:branched-chain amino acid transport system ATP-binding protein
VKGKEILSVANIHVKFGGLMALSDVSSSVLEHTITSIIGPNGAGKTTLINVISGTVAQLKGEVRLRDRTVTGLPPYKIAECGIARTFQNIRLFRNMTAMENVMVACHLKTSSGFLACSMKLPSSRRDEKITRGKALEYLDFVGLKESAHKDALSLPFGMQRHLEIARAMALEPKLMLLDEPAGGMNPGETEKLAGLIGKIRERGITVVLIEHDMNLVMNISNWIVVLNYGQKIAEGTPKEIQRNDVVIEAYLGKSASYDL